MLAKNSAYWVKLTLRKLRRPFRNRTFIICCLVLFSSVTLNYHQYTKSEQIVFNSLKNESLSRIVLSVSKEQNIDPLLVTSIILSESSAYPYAVSHMKAKGLMQLMPATALYVAKSVKHPAYEELKKNPSKIFEPRLNLELAIIHLKGMFSYMKDTNWRKTLHVYNLGSGAYKRGRRNYPYVNKIIKRISYWQEQS